MRSHRSAAREIGRRDRIEALEDTLELLSDPSALAEIAEARLEVRAGRSVSAEELRAKYLGG